MRPCWRSSARSRAWRRTCRLVGQRASSRSSRRSEEHTSELQSHSDLVCRLLLEKKKTGRDLEASGDVRCNGVVGLDVAALRYTLGAGDVVRVKLRSMEDVCDK